MTTVIIYVTDVTWLQQSIDDLLNKSRVDNIIICNDNNCDLSDFKFQPNINVQSTDSIGKAKAWNLATENINGNLIFIDIPIKISNGCIDDIVHKLHLDSECIVSPSIYSLDTNLWQSNELLYNSIGFRKDFQQYNKWSVGLTPIVHHAIFGIRSERFKDIKCFDTELSNGYETCELSIKNWILGGKCSILDKSIAASNSVRNHDDNSISRIVSMWLESFRTSFIEDNTNNTNLSKFLYTSYFEQMRTMSDYEYISELLPEFRINEFKNIASNKSIAIVGPGPSLDFINSSDILKHDIIIGIDYICNKYPCDYIFSNDDNILEEIKTDENVQKIFMPLEYNKPNLRNIRTFESIYDNRNLTVNPPFLNHNNIMNSAIHFAIFLNPRTITIYGYDNKIINNKSHCTTIDQYDNGEIWDDTEYTRKRFASNEYHLNNLSKLSSDTGIPLMRVTHA